MASNDFCRVCGSDARSKMVDGVRDWEYGVAGEYGYYRCSQCGMIQIHPFPDLCALRKAYDIDYHGHASGAQRGYIIEKLLEVNDLLIRFGLKKYLKPGCAILDVGCGSGAFLEKLKFIHPMRLDGIDFSIKAVQMAQAKGIMIYHGVFADFPSPDGVYDVIFMNNYLEHVIDPMGELLKARRLLKAGGLLVGEVPNFKSFDQWLFGKYWGGNHVPRHTFQFAPQSLSDLLEKAGYQQISIHHQINPSHFALSVQNYMQRNKVDLYNNKSLIKGRAKGYYSLLLLGLLPINIILAWMRRSGLMRFAARNN
ncbi:MAG: class I SAM-dependent methyltransferase [Magnetococcales bacterium]|nr:class I SAM-dependent methyltransferase [Magnetococcales bacterium]